MNFPSASAYSWLMIAGILVSIAFWSRLARRDDRLLLVYVAALIGAFTGAKLVYFAAEGWMHFGAPDVWLQLATGKSILGALLGGYAGVETAKKLVGYKNVTGDWFAAIAPVGIAIGRVGCLLHGCCLGEICEPPRWWTLRDANGLARWPAVPLELGFNVLAILVFFILRKKRILPGQHFHLYMIGYGLFRFAHEFLRATPRVLPGFSGYQLFAAVLAAAGVAGFASRWKRQAGPGAVPNPFGENAGTA
jgi:phosphatidylglycerol:prolipoprotein diacylglycerol transferase